MLLLWDLYWPVLAAGLIIGVVTGTIAYRPVGRRMYSLAVHAAGVAATAAATAIWHWPVGTSATFRTTVETTVRDTLDYYEMSQVNAALEQDPLGRTLLLSGVADDFQRSELIRIMGDVPGVAEVQWQDSGQGASHLLPLLAEVELWSLVAFGTGLLLSYLVEVRRRARAEWRW